MLFFFAFFFAFFFVFTGARGKEGIGWKFFEFEIPPRYACGSGASVLSLCHVSYALRDEREEAGRQTRCFPRSADLGCRFIGSCARV